MTTISLQEMQQDPLGWLRRVEAGETLVVVREHQAVAEIKPVLPKSPSRRPFGLCAGEFIVPEDFDQPLPNAVLDEFSGS